jgi:hypothetical protein
MDTPIAGWMAENTGMHTYENRFYTLDDLKKEGAPGYVVAMVEGYDPDSQVIVAIEYDPGVDAEPEIIELKDLPI